MIRIVPAYEVVVGDIEVARTRVVREDTKVDVLEPAPLDGQPFGAGDKLRARPDRDVSISKRHSFKIIVIPGLDIEEVEITVTVEYDFSMTGAFDHDGLIGRAAGRQIIRSLNRCGGVDPAIASIVFGMVLVEPGVYQNPVARLDP